MQTESQPVSIEAGGAQGSRARFSWNRLITSALAALGAGLVASLLAVLMMSFLRLVFGIPTPVELFGDHLLKLLPAPRFVDLLVRFSPNSKTAPLGLALLGMIALGTGLGLLYALITRARLPVQGNRPGRREWLIALAFALGMTLVAIILFWGELPQNFYGLPVAWAMFVTALGLLADFGLYALALCLCYRVLLPKQRVAGTAELQNNRRRLLARAGVAALGVGSAAGSVGLIKGLLNNYASYDGMQTLAKNGFTPPITPNSEHYAVTQNVVDPSVNTGLWRLEVTGLVGAPGAYTYDELQNLPSTTRAITLECIANYVGGHLISTAIWQGVTLRSLLEKHGGALPSARYVAFYSVDGYSVSQPLDVVLQADALLAWRMNGAELPMRHGYPLRVLIPGRYGEENPKWLTRIELTDHFVGGLYADQGWYNGPLHTLTRIDRPLGRVPLSSTIEIGGIAFAGNRGIQKVEISTDGGANWNVAKLDPPLSQDSWVFWTWQWHPILPGTYTLVARATDGTGALQTATKQGTVPNGATGYHVVTMQVG
ncbi:MAG TPA: molybdopterin-dependent oxidoreductase [Ktedonobacteraceae bacterium]|nr:molybdopterin-dependent oxidoreductase [Ktedonobacteraceae bacterium]